jgi:RimJ/RimL family protein N-acetyltransferase
VLDRFRSALGAHPARAVVRLTGDCPLTDPALVEATVARHHDSGADYTCNVIPRTFPKGLDVEVVDAAALEAAAATATDPPEREHVTPYFYRHPERFRLANVRCPELLGDERWTVDTPEDLAFVREVAGALGTAPGYGWREILAFAGRRVRPAPGDLHLRPAVEDDEDRLLEWRNDPVSVRFAETGAPVEPADHRQWFRARLDDPATRISIAEIDGRAIGMTRIDVRAAVGRVSVALDPAQRGQGLGTKILLALADSLIGDFQVDRLDATVHEGNAASRRAFERAGFAPAGGDHAEWRSYTRLNRPPAEPIGNR